MKKAFFTVLILLSLLATGIGNVHALDGLITLVETRNDAGGGVIFVFEYSGEFPKSYFKGSVAVGDEKYPIHCNVVEAGLVQCTSSRATAGRNVVVFLGEFVFWTFVPESAPSVQKAPSQYCYNVYDYYPSGDGEGEPEEVVEGAAVFSTGQEWVAFDVHCQDTPANFGDVENIYNPDYDGSYDYEFLPESPDFCADNIIIEDAYYYNDCSEFIPS